MSSRRRRLDPVGPFGNPDGSRADIEDLISEFVDFGGNPAYGHLATRANDSKVRVIVGKLGAGKTVYLRRLQDFQAHQDSVYADPPQQSLPKTEVIVKACQWFSDRVLVEKWMQIWERAIMRSLVSHLLRHPELRQQVRDEQAAEIEQSYGRLLGDFRRPRSIYSEVRDIINQQHNAHQLSTYLDDPLWDDLEDLLGEVLSQCKPIYFYLDAIDEEFSHAPMYWLKCQEGLFYQVMRLLRDHKLGGRLHVVVCIRDIVMSSVYRSEHAPRYYNEPHIRVLTWDRSSLLYLLEQKLRRLPVSLLMRRTTSGHPTIHDWLGVNGSWPGPNGDASIEDYLLSHTRLIPRDIISLGNELSEEVLRQKQAGREGMPAAALEGVVQRSAKRFGDSQLAQCANQISSDLMPENAALQDYSELFTSTQAYISGVQEDVRSFVRMMGVDRFSRGDLAALQEVADLHFEKTTNLASVLWQNGLLGYVDESGQRRFYSMGDVEQFHFPPDVDAYVLHPCLTYAVGGIEHVRGDSAGAGTRARPRPFRPPGRTAVLAATTQLASGQALPEAGHGGDAIHGGPGPPTTPPVTSSTTASRSSRCSGRAGSRRSTGCATTSRARSERSSSSTPPPGMRRCAARSARCGKSIIATWWRSSGPARPTRASGISSPSSLTGSRWRSSSRESGLCVTGRRWTSHSTCSRRSSPSTRRTDPPRHQTAQRHADPRGSEAPRLQHRFPIRRPGAHAVRHAALSAAGRRPHALGRFHRPVRRRRAALPVALQRQPSVPECDARARRSGDRSANVPLRPRPDLAEFLVKACAPASRDRFATAGEMRLALRDIRAHL